MCVSAESAPAIVQSELLDLDDRVTGFELPAWYFVEEIMKAGLGYRASCRPAGRHCQWTWLQTVMVIRHGTGPGQHFLKCLCPCRRLRAPVKCPGLTMDACSIAVNSNFGEKGYTAISALAGTYSGRPGVRSFWFRCDMRTLTDRQGGIWHRSGTK